jgi:Asp-tRNA(Asn)/Glu-tRNA(Gln) amidotransferase A subunit family amidase
VLLGKANMDEFAMGSSNETSFHGPVLNPWDPARVPGGSSGGSAAAVAACLAPAASGTDTGGSIRQPAALTNLTGLKPTYGRVSRYGMIAFASSLDQAGVLCRSAQDAALLLEAMAGFDPRDSTSVDRPVPHYATGLDQPLAGLRIGLISQFFGEGLDPEVERCVRAAIALLQQEGAVVKDLSLPNAAALGADLLRRGARRVLVEPLALRRRALRPPLRAAARPARPLPALPRRGLRRRGQAPHHDGHVRALGGLLRRLLPQGAEVPQR